MKWVRMNLEVRKEIACAEDAFKKSGYEKQHRNRCISVDIWEIKSNSENIRDAMWIWYWKDKGVPDRSSKVFIQQIFTKHILNARHCPR